MPRKRNEVGIIQFLFGRSNSDRARRDQYRPSTIGKNLVSPINDYGTCFGCDGSGQRTLACRVCDGTGQYRGQCRSCSASGVRERPAKTCFGCQGTGANSGRTCHRCGGSGIFKESEFSSCHRCAGTGIFESECRRCSGAGEFSVECRKCGGSGWVRLNKYD